MDRREFIKKSKFIYFDCGDKHADFERKVFDDFLENINDKLVLNLKDEWFMNESDMYNLHHIKFRENMEIILPLISEFIGINPDMGLFEEHPIDSMVSYLSCKDEECRFTIDDGKQLYKGGFDILVGHTFPEGRSSIFTYYHKQFSFTHTSVTILNENTDSKRILLMSYDSYMAPFIPILAYYFKKIILLDYDRKFDTIYKTADEFIGDSEITDFVIELSPRHRLTHFLNESWLVKPQIIANGSNTKEELLNKARYILFDTKDVQSQEDAKYIDYIKKNKDIYVVYDRDASNRLTNESTNQNHHFTYNKNMGIQGVFPNICNFLLLEYNPEDFEDKEVEGYDLNYMGYMLPVRNKSFMIERAFGTTKGDFSSLVGFVAEDKIDSDPYHSQFSFPHLNCKITNLSDNNGRVLLLSSDSYMIPFIPVLSYYFHKVIVLDYFSNRMPLYYDYKDLIKGEDITDIVMAISTYHPVKHFIEENFTERRREVGIYCGLNFGFKWDENSLYEKNGLGGSETWAVQLSNSLQEKGYDVTIYGEPSYDHDAINGVHYKHCDTFWGNDYGKHFDHFIASRLVEPITDDLNCDDVYLMSHDTVFTGAGTFEELPMKHIRKIVALSKWHGDVLKYIYKGLNDSNLSYNFNGIDTSLYNNSENMFKTNSMVWSSRSERGLRFFLGKVFPLIKKEIPDFTVYVALYSSIGNDFPEEFRNIDGIVPMGSLTKNYLSKLQKEAKIWIYPNFGYYDNMINKFHETFCISAVENAFSRNAIVTLNAGGLATTLMGYKGLIGGEYINGNNIVNENATVDFDRMDELAEILANQSIKILKDDSYRKELADNAYDICKKYTWDNVADRWIALWGEKKPEDIKILGVTFTYNESKRIPYVMPYYERMGIDKLIVYDNLSTDNTVELLKQYPFVEIRINDTKGACDNKRLTYLKNEGWKDCRNEYDWCICCDFDEVLYSKKNFRNVLSNMYNKGCYCYRRTMLNLFFDNFPDNSKEKYIHKLTEYAEPWIYGTNLYISKFPYGDKVLLFNLSQITEMNYGFGAHSCYPNGVGASYFCKDIEIYHLKYLDKQYLIDDSIAKFNRQNAKGGRDTGRYGIMKDGSAINRIYKLMNNFKIKISDYEKMITDGNYYPINLFVVTRVKDLSKLPQMAKSMEDNILSTLDINLKWMIFKDEQTEYDDIYKNLGRLKWNARIFTDYYNDEYYYMYDLNNTVKETYGYSWILILDEGDMVHFNLPFVIRETMGNFPDAEEVTLRSLNGDGTNNILEGKLFKGNAIYKNDRNIIHMDRLRECNSRCAYLKGMVRSADDFSYDTSRLTRDEMTLSIQSEWDVPANVYRVPTELQEEIFEKIRNYYETR